MMSSPDMPLKNLRILMAEDLASCTQLPDGLCQLPYLAFLQIDRAPAIKRVGHEFLQSYHHQNPHPSKTVVSFLRLHTMKLMGLVDWEEWKWEEQVQAFPALTELILFECNLRRLPPGLASQARALKVLSIQQVKGLISLENIASLIELQVIENFQLEKSLISQTAEAPSPTAQSCSLALLASMAVAQSGPEWDKFSHIEHVKAYAQEGNNPRRWYAMYTANPYNLETNVSSSAFMYKGSMNLLSILHDSSLFNECQKGDLLNGSKLKVSLDGSEVGEYLIGDEEYPLLPWLLTPYKEEELSDSKVEFNRRHSARICTLNNVLARFKDTWKYLQVEHGGGQSGHSE
ncbi:hypothetical protein ZWY2020_027804 [Hordeum vulgare]|nr:hypothetical protein ZWY2020_027804 [Hordeum vulgare]